MTNLDKKDRTKSEFLYEPFHFLEPHDDSKYDFNWNMN
jgi:hypothetical protein